MTATRSPFNSRGYAVRTVKPSPLNSRGYIVRCTHGFRCASKKGPWRGPPTVAEIICGCGGTPSGCIYIVRRPFRRSCRPTAIERRRFQRLSATPSASLLRDQHQLVRLVHVHHVRRLHDDPVEGHGERAELRGLLVDRNDALGHDHRLLARC